MVTKRQYALGYLEKPAKVVGVVAISPILKTFTEKENDEMFNREKVQKQLEFVQGGCTARTISIDEIAHMVTVSEQETRNMPKWILKYLTFEYVEAVPNAYSYTAQATRAQFDFTQKGTVKTIKLDRVNARSQAYGGYIKRLVLNVDAMTLAEYGIEYDAHNLLINRLIACHGFNHQGTLPVA